MPSMFQKFLMLFEVEKQPDKQKIMDKRSTKIKVIDKKYIKLKI